MAGPVPTYLATQLAAQTAFTVPFGLITLVNGDITAATAAGQFNTTVDCSLFTAEDVSNLRIYLDSLGYKIEFAKGSTKSLLIDWGQPLDIDGNSADIVTANQGAPNSLANGWPVKITDGSVVLGTPANPLVTTSEGNTGTPVNQYAENTAVPSSIFTTIVSYTVPALKTLKITGFVGWGQYNGEFLVKVDSVMVGGGWSTPSNITLLVDYSVAPIVANAGQVVTIGVTHYASSTQDFKANLLGVLQ